MSEKSQSFNTLPGYASKEAVHHTHRSSYLLVSILVVAAILVVLNFIAGRLNLRADLTENNIFTLSQGTRNILKSLDTPVTIRYYVTDGMDMMGPAERSYAERVYDLLKEYKKIAGGMLKVEKLNPEPNTDLEDAAIAHGLRKGLSMDRRDELYMGIHVQCLDQSEVLPFLPARPETMLEYDLSRAISNVHSSEHGKPKIRMMTSVQVAGGFAGPGQQGPEPWMAFLQLKRDYNLEMIPVSGDPIAEDTAALIVLHPYDLTDEAQFAIDQYLLKGGKVMMLLDPMFFAARFMSPPQNPMMPQPSMGPEPSSNAEKLLDAWGVKYTDNQVLADTTYQTQIQNGILSPTVLSLSADAFDSKDPVTANLTYMFCVAPGAFQYDEMPGMTKEVLVSSSTQNQLVSTFEADPTQQMALQELRKNFKPSGEKKALVMRLSGKFATAFPKGDPANQKDEGEDESLEIEPQAGLSAPGDAEGDGDGEEESAKAKAGDEELAAEADEEKEAAPADDGSLKESEKEGVVFLISDVDFIFNEFALERNFLGEYVARNSNLSLLLNAVDQLAGPTDLLEIRSRATNQRLFTRLNEIEAKGRARFQDELAEVEKAQQEANEKLTELQGDKPEGQEMILSPEQEEAIKEFRQKVKDFSDRQRDIEKAMTREFNALQSLIKVSNTFIMPLIVILVGVFVGVSLHRRSAAGR